MDRSTQCDFPVIRTPQTAYLKKRLTDLNLNRSFQTLPNPWVQIRPRPRSLNVSTETFHRSKISFLSEKSSHHSSSELSLSRERTPPRSLKGRPPEQPAPASNCKCFFEQDEKTAKGPPGVTPEGLSWRRLHMSRAKLKATSTTSELLSGFAMVAMVELQINVPTNVPGWLFVMFAVCTTVLVSVHIFALMISTYILPNIDAISKLDVCELVAESPHERMRGFIELAWAFSTVLGLFLFLVEVTILCWVKFWDYSFSAAIAATVIVIPVLVIFVLFTVHFYHSLVVYKCDASVTDLEKLEELKKNLDNSPV